MLSCWLFSTRRIEGELLKQVVTSESYNCNNYSIGNFCINFITKTVLQSEVSDRSNLFLKSDANLRLHSIRFINLWLAEFNWFLLIFWPPGRHCYLFDDPHIVTFDGHRYDWHGVCNYTVAASDSTHYPNVGVFSDFARCWGCASCLDRTTFRNDPHTLITLDHGAVFDVSWRWEEWDSSKVMTRLGWRISVKQYVQYLIFFFLMLRRKLNTSKQTASLALNGNTDC